MKKKTVVAGALGAVLGWTGAGAAQETPRPFPLAADSTAKTAAKTPSAAESFNQRMANAIAMYLKAGGQLRGCNVDIAFADGIADISGQVNDMAQRAHALYVVRTIPGVRAVRDRLMVGSGMPTFAMAPGFVPPPAPPVAPPAAPAVVPTQAVGPEPKLEDKGLPEPLSIMPMPAAPFNPAYNPPPMPPYAWPTYAPYNNLSRVAYPLEYPYEAWPFIGPMYPFPKVPPGWRGVSLQWEDGHWWYGRKATGHDWWRVRYW